MISRRALLLSLLPQGTSLVALDVRTGRTLESHRAEAAPSPPGSTLKPFVLAALIEDQLLPSDPRRACPTRLSVGNHRLDCTHGPLAAPPGPEEALAYSCNCWFAAMSQRLRPTTLSRWGFSRIQSAADTALLALGVEGILTSPLELAQAYRRLALERPKTRSFDPVFRGLAAAAEYGTARLARPDGLTIAGKTGTVGVPLAAWFAGYAPEDDPRWVVTVYLEQGRGGSQAAPIAKECFERLRSSSR